MSESRSPFTVVVEDSGPLYSEFNHRVMVRASPLLLWCPSFRLPPGVSDSDKPRPLYQSKYRHHHLDRLDRFAVIHYRSPYLATSLLFTFIFPLSASASLHLSGSHDPSPALPLRSLLGSSRLRLQIDPLRLISWQKCAWLLPLRCHIALLLIGCLD